MAKVFLSHASTDIALALEVHRWLEDGRHEIFLHQHPHAGIPLGEQWEQQLFERLRWADAVVCVVTVAFLASTWCAAEVGIARSLGIRLLPLCAEPGVTHPLLRSTQHIDLVPNQRAARAALAKALRRVGNAWPEDRSPFPGLEPFEVDRRWVFFGRSDEIRQLSGLLRSPAERAEGALVLVVGPSGCGKSSLVRAGLVPVMAEEPGWWVLPSFVPGTDPVGVLARELAAAAQLSGLNWTVASVHDRFADGDFPGLAGELLPALPGGPQRRLLIVIDQFEELLTQTAPPDRSRFLGVLHSGLAGPVQLVVTLRSEFLDPLLSDPALEGMAVRPYPVRPLGQGALRAVIEQPARLAGIEVDPALVDRLVEDTETGDALPLLAFTLALLANRVRRGGQLSAAQYEELGGVRGALVRQADAALAAAVIAGGRSQQEVIAGLLRLVTVDEQGRPTRWRTRRDELPGPVAAELDAFVERRLLTTDNADGRGGVIGVAHEAFLSAWSPLRGAIAAAASALRARRAVEHAAASWENHGRPLARLWSGDQLAVAVADTGAQIRAEPAPQISSSSPRRAPALGLPGHRRMLVTDRVDLSSTARDFLHASIRRDRYHRRRGVTVLSILLVLAVAGAGIAYLQQRHAQTQQRIAQTQQRIATARQLVAQAEVVRDTDPRTALQLGIAAQRLDPGNETDASLVRTLTTTRYTGSLSVPAGPVNSIAFAPDGRTLATTSFDGVVSLWDLADRTHPLAQTLTDYTGPVDVVGFAPDGHILATTSFDGTVSLWDITDRAQPRRLGQPLTVPTDAVHSVAFTSDGHILATTSSKDETVSLWDLTDRAQPRRLGQPLIGHTTLVVSVAFSSDGHTLATADSDGAVFLWDRADPTRPLTRPLTDYTGPVDSVALAPDGHMLATTSFDGTVSLWDITDRAQPRQFGQALTFPSGTVKSMAFSPDGHVLATGTEDGTVSRWDLTYPTQPAGHPLAVFTDPVIWVAFTLDGRALAAGTKQGGVSLWNLTDRARPRRLERLIAFPSNTAHAVAFSPDRRTLATTSGDGVMILWDITDQAQPRRLGQARTDQVSALAFSSDGNTLATASFDGAVIVWDVTDRTQPRRLGQTRPARNGTVTFSPRGHTLTTVSFDGVVTRWDLTDRAQPRRLDPPSTVPTGTVDSVALTPDGHTLATVGSKDGRVSLWDLTDRAQPRRLGHTLPGPTGQVFSLAFTADGRTLATGNLDGTVTLWDFSGLDDLRAHAVAHACAITGQGLTPQEWDHFISGLPYQNTCPDRTR